VGRAHARTALTACTAILLRDRCVGRGAGRGSLLVDLAHGFGFRRIGLGLARQFGRAGLGWAIRAGRVISDGGGVHIATVRDVWQEASACFDIGSDLVVDRRRRSVASKTGAE